MLNKNATYFIIINKKSEEIDLITLFHKIDIFWVDKNHPFSYLNLQEKLVKIDSMGYDFPLCINLVFNNIDDCWIYMYVVNKRDSITIEKFLEDMSGNGAKIELNITKLLRKYKLQTIHRS